MSNSLHVPSSPTMDGDRGPSSLVPPDSVTACLLNNGNTYAQHVSSTGTFSLSTGPSIHLAGSFDALLPNSEGTLFALVNHSSSTIILVINRPANGTALSRWAALGGAEFGRDRLAWVAWHPLSATDNHLAALTEGGLFCLFHINVATTTATEDMTANSRIEMRLKIRSPEDYSLRCTTAAWMEGAQGIWVGMENGDLLACSPILPFPLRIDRLSACRLNLDPLQSIGRDNIGGGGGAGDVNPSSIRSHTLVTINRPPRSWHQRLPHVHGPLLIQPEPLELTGPARGMHSFTSSQFGLTFLVVITNNGALHLLLLESSLRRDEEDSVDDEIVTATGTSLNANPLTLLETIKIPGVDPSRTKIAFCEDGYFLLLWTSNNQLCHISLPWLPTLFSLDGENREELNRVLRSKLTCSNNAIDFVLLGRSLLLLVKEGISGDQISIVRKGVAPLLGDLDQHLSLAIKISSSSPISDTTPVPLSPSLPLPYGASIELPKLQLPTRLSKTKFIEMTEDDMEHLVSIVERWQQSVLMTCTALARSTKLRVASLLEAARKQKECSSVLLEKRVPTLLKQLWSDESQLKDHEATLKHAKLRLGPSCQQESHHWSKIVESLTQLRKRIGRMLPLAPGPRPLTTLKDVEEQLRSHEDLLDRIRQSIHSLCLESAKESQ